MPTILGAAPDTGNQGVSALCYSAVNGLTRRGIEDITIADHGIGQRMDDSGFKRIGLSHTKRIWRGDCLRTVSVLAPMGGGFSATARAIAGSRAILDVSGGDSFTDLYGPKRFAAMTMAKQTALRCGVPLILLPQTLGPFERPESRKVARDILKQAAGVWVRDAKSEGFLQDVLGDDYDPEKHHRGPDMAVLLPKTEPRNIPTQIRPWFAPTRLFPVAGLNTSGLLWQDETGAKARFGLTASHREQLMATARALLEAKADLRLLLVPHVLRPEGDPESDHDAALALKARLNDEFGDRIAVLPQDYDAMQLKWIISQLDWFAGARMHATIAAFSSGVPTLGLGYSDKAAGVFEECGIADHVADLRQVSTAELARVVRASFDNREALKKDLGRTLPKVRYRATKQMDQIAATIRNLPQ